MVRKPICSPVKYKTILDALDPEVVYTPASIANFAESNDFIKAKDQEAIKLTKQRIRIYMGRFSNKYMFPDKGDVLMAIEGKAPTPGWFGSDWQKAADFSVKASQ